MKNVEYRSPDLKLGLVIDSELLIAGSSVTTGSSSSDESSSSS